MSQLSLLEELFRKQQPQQGQIGPRTSSGPTAMRGFTRGQRGSQGASRLKKRDSDAGWSKEVEMMQSPIFQAFTRQFVGETPITDYLAGR